MIDHERLEAEARRMVEGGPIHAARTVAVAYLETLDILRKIARAGVENYLEVEDGYLVLDLHVSNLTGEEFQTLRAMEIKARAEQDDAYWASQEDPQ